MRVGLALSGGKSSRMGKDKSAITVGSSTMLERSIALLNALGLDKVVISGLNFDIPDIFPDKGPVGGIYSAIQSLSLKAGDIVLIIPNDMPLLRSEVLLALLEHSVSQQCTCIYNKHPMPLCLFLSEAVLTRISLLESAAGMSIRYLIEADRVEELAVDSHAVFSNVNTPQELEDAVKKYNNMY
ncbi:molybdenum cofactor guanylyltransferase [Brumicola nitratireducens]|uniref:Putative molybdopterin biosynthesis protein n=1 Tax=Glaciecola nitratireducens (strain JCM 12485 / KCTC 12276 / FR1064) TaxID=1085623 RepID=G4QGK5_GLANF|nr:molybdenum cofactor guanylyltransferase [Glaciecola nitratireducens]AEP29642.1 putative molybdopterin biosynthesis protein [Glaciecola nitratireducens FR1064]